MINFKEEFIMLRDSLPEIVTDKVPGPKATSLLVKRDASLPKALCGYTYPYLLSAAKAQCLKMSTEINLLILSAVSVF